MALDVANLNLIAAPPNWRGGVRLGVAYTTFIERAVNGHEQRQSVQAYPRLSLTVQMDALAELLKMRQMQARLRRGYGEHNLLPLWTEAVRVTADTPSGATELPVTDTQNRLWQAGRWCAVFREEARYELREVAAVSPLAVTLATPLDNDVPAGAVVAPLMITDALPPQKAEISWWTAWQNSAALEISEDVRYSQPFPFAEYDATYGIYSYSLGDEDKSLRVFPFLWEWRNGTGEHFERPQISQSTDTLLSYASGFYPTAAAVLRAEISLFNRRQIARFLRFFELARGRRSQFLLPTCKAEFRVVSSGTNTTQFWAEDSQWVETGWGDVAARNDQSRRLLFLLHPPTGTWHIRRVAAVSKDGPYERFTLAASVPAITPQTIVCFALCARFTTDDVILNMPHSEHADAMVEFTEIMGEYASFIAGTAVNGSLQEPRELIA